ncbi:MAG: hypothetical protein ACLP50_23740, partial [Solirubrobacteraceae bacterium]
ALRELIGDVCPSEHRPGEVRHDGALQTPLDGGLLGAKADGSLRSMYLGGSCPVTLRLAERAGPQRFQTPAISGDCATPLDRRPGPC